MFGVGLLNMRIENLLEKKKDALLKKWFNICIKAYPEDTATFYLKNKDAFANPVGSTIFQGLKAVLEELLVGMDHEVLKSFIDPIIRMRAVQGFSPSEAVSFIFSLKAVIRKMYAKKIQEDEFARALLAFESKIDTLSLISFDIYNACREKIYDIKANEVRNRTYRAFKRANLVADSSVE